MKRNDCFDSTQFGSLVLTFHSQLEIECLSHKKFFIRNGDNKNVWRYFSEFKVKK